MKDIVTFQQALSLKKLEFFEKCLYHYDRDKKLIPNVSASDLVYKSFNVWKWEKAKYDAPTIYQVCEWLRKEKGIHVVMNPFFKKGEILYTPYIATYDWGRKCEGDFPCEFGKALLIGVKKALDILENGGD